MEGFRTARALVLDDRPEDAMPIIHALGKLGIGVLYSDGSMDPQWQKVNGIRLLCVDMLLTELGATPDNPDNCISVLIGTLQSLLQDSFGPVVILSWTEHGDLIDGFEGAFRKSFSSLVVHALIRLEKSRLKNDINGLIAEIKTALAQFEPLNLLLSWEEAVHNAATRTTNSMTNIVHELEVTSKRTRVDCGYTVCAALALGERGSRLRSEDGASAVKSLNDALVPLLSDSLEYMRFNMALEASTKLFDKVMLLTRNSEREYASDGRSQDISEKIADESHDAKDTRVDTVSPGALVVAIGGGITPGQETTEGVTTTEPKSIAPIANDNQTPGSEESEGRRGKIDGPEGTLSVAAVSTTSIVTQSLSKFVQAKLNAMIMLSQDPITEAFPGNVYLVPRKTINRLRIDSNIEWQELTDDTFWNYRGRLPPNHFPLVVEITASCDFAQKKHKQARFAAGFICPIDSRPSIRQSSYLKIVGPVYITDKSHSIDGEYIMLINAHYLIGVKSLVAKDMSASFRLRKDLLADLVAWLGSHMSRPGHLEIE